MTAMAYGTAKSGTQLLRSEALDYLRCISLAKVKDPKDGPRPGGQGGLQGKKKPNKRAKERTKAGRPERRQGPGALGILNGCSGDTLCSYLCFLGSGRGAGRGALRPAAVLPTAQYLQLGWRETRCISLCLNQPECNLVNWLQGGTRPRDKAGTKGPRAHNWNPARQQGPGAKGPLIDCISVHENNAKTA